MDKYKTGDVTISKEFVRIYICDPDGISGYFVWCSNNRACVFVRHKDDSTSLWKSEYEPVVCHLTSVMEALFNTYGNKVRNSSES